MIKKNPQTFLWISVFFVLVCFGIGCKKQQAASDTRSAFGTSVTVTIYDEGQTHESLDRAFDEVYDLIGWWEKRVISPGSENELRKIAESSGTQSIPVDTAVYEMLMKALRLQDASGELFDVRSGPLMDVWGFDSSPHVPSQAAIDSARALVRDGGMFVAGKSILLAKKGMHFNVNEFITGYVFDSAAEHLKSRGFKNFSINSPRVWRVEGTSPNPKGFEIPIGNPEKSDNTWARVYIKSGGLAIMDMSYRRFTDAGKIYHGILDPRTGWPATHHAAAIVHSKEASAAEALAYSIFVAGEGDQIPDLGTSHIQGSIIVNGTDGHYVTVRDGSLSDAFELVN